MQPMQSMQPMQKTLFATTEIFNLFKAALVFFSRATRSRDRETLRRVVVMGSLRSVYHRAVQPARRLARGSRSRSGSISLARPRHEEVRRYTPVHHRISRWILLP